MRSLTGNRWLIGALIALLQLSFVANLAGCRLSRWIGDDHCCCAVGLSDELSELPGEPVAEELPSCCSGAPVEAEARSGSAQRVEQNASLGEPARTPCDCDPVVERPLLFASDSVSETPVESESAGAWLALSAPFETDTHATRPRPARDGPPPRVQWTGPPLRILHQTFLI